MTETAPSADPAATSSDPGVPADQDLNINLIMLRLIAGMILTMFGSMVALLLANVYLPARIREKVQAALDWLYDFIEDWALDEEKLVSTAEERR